MGQRAGEERRPRGLLMQGVLRIEGHQTWLSDHHHQPPPSPLPHGPPGGTALASESLANAHALAGHCAVGAHLCVCKDMVGERSTAGPVPARYTVVSRTHGRQGLDGFSRLPVSPCMHICALATPGTGWHAHLCTTLLSA